MTALASEDEQERAAVAQDRESARAQIKQLGRGPGSNTHESVARMRAQEVPMRSLVRAHGLGFRLLAFDRSLKRPHETGWQNKIYTPEEIFLHDGAKNYGVITGHEISSGRFLADVDLDWKNPKGVELAKEMLPETKAMFGRPGKPLSHVFYTTPTSIPRMTFKDIDGAMLVELRGTKEDGTLGWQTMIPPSVHPGKPKENDPGGALAWLHEDWELAHVATADLIDCARWTATVMLIAQHWPKVIGHRHDLRLAYARVLLEALAIPDDEAQEILELACEAGGSDAKGIANVEEAIKTTRKRLTNGEPATGAKTVQETLPDGAKIIALLRKWYDARDFRRDRNQKIVANELDNIRLALDKLDYVLSQDLFAEKKLVTHNGKTQPLADDALNSIWIEMSDRFGFAPSIEVLLRVLQDEAARRSFHPVRDYLSSLVWDGTPRIDTWLQQYGGATDSRYVQAVSALVLIAAVRRVRQPGCKFDELLILESAQGKDKSNALLKLCPLSQWFASEIPLNLDAKRMIEATLGIWIGEVADLAGFSSAKIEHLKAMLSRQVDGPTRMAYARLPVTRARQFVLIGTTNATKYLTDPTGGRRFWPVRITRFKSDDIERDRDQLWAEAASREADRESIRLPEELWPVAGIEQEERREVDAWEDTLEKKFGELPPGSKFVLEEPWIALGHDITLADGTKGREPIPIERRGNREQARVTQIMTRLGYSKRNVRLPKKPEEKEGKQAKHWVRRAVEDVE